MPNLESFALARIKEALGNADPMQVLDAYAVSFFVYDYDDDPRRPTLTVGFNTNERWRACTPASGQKPAWPIASDSGEAEWNYAFWLQNEVFVLGEPETQGAMLCEQWLKSIGLWFTDEDYYTDPKACHEIASGITDAFADLCVRMAQALHEEQFIVTCFGSSIPIIVHELEYYDEIGDRTRRANPPGLADEFLSWLNTLG